MRAVVGVIAPDAGEVRWRGAPVDAAARRTFGYMPEERGLYPGMIVLEQLVYLGRLYGMTAAEARSSALEWTERLGIADKRDLKIETLSQGNQQRVQLAAALVHGPELLVLDEPFSGLDPVGVDDMSAVLAERAAAGATVLFSSHQLDLVQDICEAVAIIHRGRLVAQGRLADLRRGGEPRLAVRVAGDPEGRWAAGLAPAARVTGVTSGTVSLALAPGADAQQVLDAGALGRPGGALRLRGPAPLRGVPRGRRRRPGRGGPGGARRTSRGGHRRRAVMNGWLGTTWLIAARELRQGARARSFRIVTVLLVAAVAAAILIPAALHGHKSAQKVGVVGSGPAAVLTVRTAARISGAAVQTVPFATLDEAEAALRDGTVAAVLVSGREVLIPRTPYAGVRRRTRRAWRAPWRSPAA